MTTADTTGRNGVVACDVCLKEVPRSVARSLEGPDYVYHFCGQTCYENWLAGPAMRVIGLVVSGLALDFERAQALARTAAQGAMLLAWFDRERGQESPRVPECQHKPGWLAYAESHGGNLRVDVNHGAYVFVFATEQQG